MKKSKFAATVMAGMLSMSLGLAACSSTTTTSTSTTDENGTTTTTETTTTTDDKGTSTTETKTTTDDKGTTTTETTSSASGAVDPSWFKDAWMGVSDKGKTYYYAEGTDTSGAAYGIWVELDPATAKYYSFVGSVDTLENNTFRVNDKSSGGTMTFQITQVMDDGSIVIDMGTEDGQAVLAKSTVDEVVQAMNSIDQNGTAVN